MYIKSILNQRNKIYRQANIKENLFTVLLASRPCDRCRKHRIKCDRSLYGCTHCSKNSIVCEYKYIPKKRGPKSKLERDCNYLRSMNKKYGNSSEETYIPSPDPSIIESSTFKDGLNAPLHNLDGSNQFGFESVNFGLPIPPPIPPILISQYFPNLSPPQSLDTAIGLISNNQAKDINMSYSPNPQVIISPAFSPNPQDLYIASTTAFSSNHQNLATTHCFSPNTQDLSLALSPELNQYFFDTPSLSQEALQTPVMDTYLTPVSSLEPNYWLTLPPSCFTNQSSVDLALRSDLSPMLI